MTQAGLSKIHETRVAVGSSYRVVTKFGEADVQVLDTQAPDGIEVEILDGGFSPPLRKRVVKGQTYTVPNGLGTWYEAK